MAVLFLSATVLIFSNTSKLVYASEHVSNTDHYHYSHVARTDKNEKLPDFSVSTGGREKASKEKEVDKNRGSKYVNNSNSLNHEKSSFNKKGVEELIVKYSLEYGVDESLMREIAYCESGFRPDAVNGPYAGVYQFLPTTWVSNRRAMGENPDPSLRYHPEEAVKTAAFKMSRDGFGAWPACSRKALSKI